jgi:hypothetical protein
LQVAAVRQFDDAVRRLASNLCQTLHLAEIEQAADQRHAQQIAIALQGRHRKRRAQPGAAMSERNTRHADRVPEHAPMLGWSVLPLSLRGAADERFG